MKLKALLISVAVTGAFLVACSIPQASLTAVKAAVSTTSSATGGSGSTVAPTTTAPISVTNDMARGVAVFTSSSGATLDVSASDPTTGQIVKCVQSDGYAVLKSSGNTNEKSPDVIVVGKRGDGSPGAWEINSKGKVSLLKKEGKGHDGELSPEAGKAPEDLHRHLGWAYKVTAISADGKMIVGYAENAKGYTHGKVSIPAGTTVGIYWRVLKSKDDSHYHLSPPRVIGTWQPPSQQKAKNRDKEHGDGHHRWMLQQLKLFFLGRLQSYLTMTTGVTYDSTNDVYVVTGTDQDGNDATATIANDGSISVQAVQPPPTTKTYSEIVIDTYNPTSAGNGYNFDVIGLFDSTGVVSSQNPWTNPTAGALVVNGQYGIGSNTNSGQIYYAYIDYKPATPLPSGTVLYVRINGYSPTHSSTGADASTGPYGIRVLAAPSSTYTYFSSVNASDSGYEPDNPPDFGAVPTAAVQITFNDPQGENRYLSPGDVDWVKITLP